MVRLRYNYILHTLRRIVERRASKQGHIGRVCVCDGDGGQLQATLLAVRQWWSLLRGFQLFGLSPTLVVLLLFVNNKVQPAHATTFSFSISNFLNKTFLFADSSPNSSSEEIIPIHKHLATNPSFYASAVCLIATTSSRVLQASSNSPANILNQWM